MTNFVTASAGRYTVFSMTNEVVTAVAFGENIVLTSDRMYWQYTFDTKWAKPISIRLKFKRDIVIDI